MENRPKGKFYFFPPKPNFLSLGPCEGANQGGGLGPLRLCTSTCVRGRGSIGSPPVRCTHAPQPHTLYPTGPPHVQNPLPNRPTSRAKPSTQQARLQFTNPQPSRPTSSPKSQQPPPGVVPAPAPPPAVADTPPGWRHTAGAWPAAGRTGQTEGRRSWPGSAEHGGRPHAGLAQ